MVVHSAKFQCVCVLTKVLLDVYTCTPRYGCADVPSIGNVFVL